jgi:hypothetical protein
MRAANERLMQAVLAKTFRYELVPTEAELARREKRTYEPAGELLARVCAERAQSVTPTNGKPTRARKAKTDTA